MKLGSRFPLRRPEYKMVGVSNKFRLPSNPYDYGHKHPEPKNRRQ